MFNVSLSMPDEKLRTLIAIVDALQGISNIAAIVLGGSYASGLARPDSDIDVDLYYYEESPFSIDEIRSVANKICSAGTVPIVTEMYGWGPWVNGGAWIQTPSGEVDFVYRNLRQVRTVIDEGLKGVWRHDYDQQPPYGFRSVIYFGETHTCVPLHDPRGEISGLKESVGRYPELLKQRIVQESLWGAEFSLWYTGTLGNSGDVYVVAGCITRVAQFLVQALFALNEEYFLSDKHAGRLIEHFAVQPRDFMPRLARVLSNPSSSSDLLSALWSETVALTGGTYKPRSNYDGALITCSETAGACRASTRAARIHHDSAF